MKNRLYLVLVLTAFMCLAGWTASAHYTKIVPRQTWEYKQEESDFSFDIASRLNQLGAEGWELVGVTSTCSEKSQSVSGCKHTAYLKREK